MNRHSESRNEAYHARKVRGAQQAERILALLRSLGHGVTIKEMAVATGLPDSTVSGRLNDLIARGEVEISPIRRRCSINDRRKQVYVVAGNSGQMTISDALRKAS